MLQTITASPASNIFGHLETATTEILRHAFELAEYREHYSKAEYHQFLKEYGWRKNGPEQKLALKVAAAFGDFVQHPEALALVEPKTLYTLIQPEYSSVISQLQDLGDITQAVVIELMKECRQNRKRKPVEAPSIWKRTPNGARYCQLPPIHEEDEATGIKIQKWMDSGHTVQYIIREAIATLALLPEWQINGTDSNADEPIVDETQAAIDFVAAQRQKQIDEVNKLLLPVPSADAANEVALLDHLTIQENLVAIADITATSTTDKIERSCKAKQLSLLAETEEAGTLAGWVVVNPPAIRPMNKQEQSFNEMDMLADEEFGDGATEPSVALINSQNYLNLMHGRIEEIKAQIENCEKKHLLKNLQNELKDWLHRSSKEIWQAHEFAVAAGINLTIYTNSSNSQFAYNFEIPEHVESDEFLADDNLQTLDNPAKIIEALEKTQVYSQIIHLTEHFSEEFKKTIWALIDDSEKERILALKEQHFQELAKIIQVGDRVTWNNAPAHFYHWMPFVVTDVQDDKATFDMYKELVPITELTKV